MKNKTTRDVPVENEQNDPPVHLILESLRGLRFGSVTVIVQDGVIVQVERLEKKRLHRTSRLD